MRVAVLADMGHATYHVGDEAMAHAVGHELATRGHEPVYLTRDADHTRRRFGDVATGRGLVFPWPLQDRLRYLREIRDVCAGHRDALPDHDQIFPFLEQIERVDALVIAGGGNMNSRYGWLLDERLAALHVAHSRGLPTFLSGQTLGPALAAIDAKDLRAELSHVLGFAAREPATAALAQRFIPAARVHRVLDDASFVGDVQAPLPEPTTPVVRGAVVVTIAPRTLGWSDCLLPVLARALDELSGAIKAPVHLVPHMADAAAHDGDEEVHAELARRMHGDVTALPIEHALLAARRAREASLVVSSRYHPVVFALDGGAPVVGLSPDRYTEQRMVGALANWGVRRGAVLDVDGPGDVDLAAAFALAHASGDSVRSALSERRSVLRADAARFWDTVVSTLESGVPSAPHLLVAPDDLGAPVEVLPARALDRDAAPAVSVIMRTRNRPRMLERALHDVASQTFADLEIVVVNDGGDPEPVDEAVAGCVGLDGRARVLHRDASTGMEAASNAGVAVARGAFLSIHDDDDTWDPWFLAQTVGYLRAHPSVHAVAGRTEIVWERFEEGAPAAITESREPFYAHLDEIVLADELRSNHLVPISLVYRASVHERIGLFDEALPVVGDWEFNLRLTRIGPIPVVGDAPIAFWHQRRTATGSDANSVLAGVRTHRSQDRLYRDRRLRAYLDEHGDGSLLFLAGLLQGLQDDATSRTATAADGVRIELAARLSEVETRLSANLEQGLQEIARETRERGLVALLRRKYHRMRTRLG